MNLATLNQYLPNDLSRLCLEYTGGTYREEKLEVLAELQEYFIMKLYQPWDNLIENFTIWVDQPLGVWPIDEIIGNYSESHVHLTSEILCMHATDIGWARTAIILINCSMAGMSIYEACELIDYFVLNEDVRFPNLIEMYEEVTSDRVGLIPLELTLDFDKEFFPV